MNLDCVCCMTTNIVLRGSNQLIDKKSSFADILLIHSDGELIMSALKETIEKLKNTGVINLTDFKALKLKDLESLSEEIKYWCLYGNGKPEKLGNKNKEH